MWLVGMIWLARQYTGRAIDQRLTLRLPADDLLLVGTAAIDRTHLYSLEESGMVSVRPFISVSESSGYVKESQLARFWLS